MAVALLLYAGSTATATPITAVVIGCVDQTCIVEPASGPVDVDPLGFSLEVLWGPNYILLGDDPGGHELMRLTFEYTGEHDGTEHLGVIHLLDALGNPIPSLNVQFDDLNPIGGIVTANYEIFGPPAALHGFTLSLSDGSGVRTMRWTRATITPATLVEVPEPSVLVLLGGGLAAAVLRRRRRPAAAD